MKLHTRPKLSQIRSKRIGRGYGSGKGGHTTIRGQKGQKSRGKVPAWFTGTSWVWFKRLPMLKGKGKFKPVGAPVKILTLSELNKLPAGSKVTLESLISAGIITARESKTHKIKFVSTGKLEKKINLQLPATKQAIETIKKLGGSVA